MFKRLTSNQSLTPSRELVTAYAHQDQIKDIQGTYAISRPFILSYPGPNDHIFVPPEHQLQPLETRSDPEPHGDLIYDIGNCFRSSCVPFSCFNFWHDTNILDTRNMYQKEWFNEEKVS